MALQGPKINDLNNKYPNSISLINRKVSFKTTELGKSNNQSYPNSPTTNESESVHSPLQQDSSQNDINASFSLKMSSKSSSRVGSSSKIVPINSQSPLGTPVGSPSRERRKPNEKPMSTLEKVS